MLLRLASRRQGTVSKAATWESVRWRSRAGATIFRLALVATGRWHVAVGWFVFLAAERSLRVLASSLLHDYGGLPLTIVRK